MKTFQLIKRVDLLIQAFLLSSTAGSVIYSLAESSALGYSLIGLLFLGIVQVSIAFIRGFILGKETDIIYFLSAILYCGMLYAGALLSDYFPNRFSDWILMVGIAFWTIIPFIAGTWYLIFQIQSDFKKENSDFV